MPAIKIRSTKEILEQLAANVERPGAMVPVSVVYELAVHIGQLESKVGGTAVSG